MRDNIIRAAKSLSGRVRVVHADYLETLRDATPLDVVYLDPPYQGTSGERDSRYVRGLSFASFCDGIRELTERRLSLIISYDGRIGEKVYGERLPRDLSLQLFEVKAGRSTQETLLGRAGVTYESLYVSEDLLSRLPQLPRLLREPVTAIEQMNLFQR